MTLRQRLGYLFVHIAVRHLELVCWLFDWTLIMRCGVLDRREPPMTIEKAMAGLIKREKRAR